MRRKSLDIQLDQGYFDVLDWAIHILFPQLDIFV